MLYASAFGAGLMATLHPEDALISGVFNCALVCAAIMACVCDSLLAGRPMPYSWRFPMLLLAPLLPITSAMVAWRSRRWWGLLAVGTNLVVLGLTLFTGSFTGFVISTILLE